MQLNQLIVCQYFSITDKPETPETPDTTEKSETSETTTPTKPTLKGLNIHYIDVGQGDATYIRTPEGYDY